MRNSGWHPPTTTPSWCGYNASLHSQHIIDGTDALDAITALLTRRSIRRYTDRPVSREQLDTLLACAMAAPSGYNEQSWRFVVVREAQTREQLAAASNWGWMAVSTPLVIVVCGDPVAERHPGQYWVQDTVAALENMLIAAHAMGLGAVWIGLYPRPERTAPVRRLLGLPEPVEPLGMVAVGHPAERKAPSSRMDWNKVHYESW